MEYRVSNPAAAAKLAAGPTKTVYDVVRGYAVDVLLEGAELDAYNAIRNAPPPAVPVPVADQFDALVAQAKTSLTAAANIADIKKVFAGTLDGLRTIYGKPDASTSPANPAPITP